MQAGKASSFALFLLFVVIFTRGNTESVNPVAWIQKADKELGVLYEEHSLFTWLFMVGEPLETQFSLNMSMNEWKAVRCSEARAFSKVPPLIKRAIYLMCRGPMYTQDLESAIFIMQSALRDLYVNSELCRENGTCYHMEPELDKLMRGSRDPALLQWAWEGWRRIMSPEGLRIYPTFIHAQNLAAINNGYKDIGECWREELEMENLEREVERLLQQIAPFHRLLHGFVRHRLRQYYGPDQVPALQPIPAHLLGNMWSQSWESILDILLNSTLDFNKSLRSKYKNVMEMAQEAEKYYLSIGFEPMTKKFWENSVITKVSPNISCHGTAANLYAEDDYRMLLCGSVTWEDFYVIHHEMGHIQYYMAYKNLPTLFKEATNSAFQEAIGDTIMLAVETPDHLKRLGIIDDNEDIGIPLLLYQALKKIPHIRFGYVVDKWRWEVMASNISVEDYNKAWWQYRTMYEGINPPAPQDPGSFDAFAKYHIPDNTPYIRYFLSEFLQFQFLEVLCEMKDAMYGIEDQELYLCDLYGFEEAGKKLKLMMSHGSMLKWPTVLEEFSGGKYNKISAKSIMKYFQPLIKWLQQRIRSENIPLGW